MQTAANPAASLGTIFMLLAFWGAIADWRYKKRGGVKPTRTHKLYLVAASTFCIATVFALFLVGVSNRGLGQLTGFLFAQVLFPLWELSRWRIRKNNLLAAETRGS